MGDWVVGLGCCWGGLASSGERRLALFVYLLRSESFRGSDTEMTGDQWRGWGSITGRVRHTKFVGGGGLLCVRGREQASRFGAVFEKRVGRRLPTGIFGRGRGMMATRALPNSLSPSRLEVPNPPTTSTRGRIRLPNLNAAFLRSILRRTTPLPDRSKRIRRSQA